MELDSIIIWVLLGGVSGWIAGKVMQGSGFGTMGNIIVGIVGSFIGGWLAQFMNISGAETGHFSFASIVTAVIGAIVFLFVLKLIKQ
jgi:uncharacterized membrane protein YeaQ/YmgE (transglycosylase-associated protein family)